MRSPLIALNQIESFQGPGIYVLFYEGNFKPYSMLSEHNRQNPGSWPIYIGKASPSTRKGKDLTPDNFEGDGLFKRLMDHRKSIGQAQNLIVEDFKARLLVLSYIWVPMAETAMIGRYQPLWNTIIDGFGNHDPGSGRSNSVRSRWDTLHPGRPWAAKYPVRIETSIQLGLEASNHLNIVMH
jgi:hypothetical protein